MPEEFDLEAFDAEWEEMQSAENEAEDVEGVEDFETPEVVEDFEPEAKAEETPDLSDAARRDSSFAQLRRERDAYAQQTAWMEQLAKDNGMTPDELRQRYEDSRLEQEAETQGIPVEILQRVQTLEQENQSIKEQTWSSNFNSQVSATIEKYNVSDTDLEKTFAYAQERGLVDSIKAGHIPFEDLHFLAHKDTIVNTQAEKAVQDSLTQKKKRQTEASIPVGTGAPDSPASLLEQADADAKRIMEEGF